jgi:hypothetical protein
MNIHSSIITFTIKGNLKRAEDEKFGSRIFTQVRPVWVGYLETRQKIQNFYGFGLKIVFCIFSTDDGGKIF